MNSDPMDATPNSNDATLRPATPPAPPSTGGATRMHSAVSFASRSMAPQDLSADKLLLAAPRMKVHDKDVPALGGIPLMAKIGQGGMGAVYIGIHPRLEKEVAIKVLPFHLGDQQPGLVTRFFREAQLAAKIESPHLVGVKDVNEDSGLFYLVMEYVSGQSAGSYLREIRKTGQPGLPEALALDICLAAAEGLAVAHRRGVIHRDVKPDNILIPKAEDSEKLLFAASKLADLGLARGDDAGQSLTGTQAAMGTPGYMAPEQALDARKAGKSADVFGLGATLYALLAGQSPFAGNTAMEVVLNTMQKPHAPLNQFRADASAVTIALIERCLQKDPAQRYIDGNALRDALKICRAAVGEPEPTQRQAIEQLTLLQKSAEVGAPAALPSEIVVSSTLVAQPPAVVAPTPQPLAFQPVITAVPVSTPAASAAPQTAITQSAPPPSAAPTVAVHITNTQSGGGGDAPAKSAIRWLGLVAVLLVVAVVGVFYIQSKAKPDGVTFVTSKTFNGNMYFTDAAKLEKEFETRKGQPLADAEVKQNLERATGLVKAGDYDGGIKALEDASKKLPDAAIYTNLGVLYARTEKIEKALEAYKAAILQDANYQPAYYNLALIEQSQGKLQDAAEHFEKAPQLSESSVYLQAAKKEMSAEFHEQEIEPNNDILHANVIAVDMKVQGAIGNNSDHDFIQFKTPPKFRDMIQISLECRTTSLTSIVQIYAADKSRIAQSGGANEGANLTFTFVGAPDSIYYVEISSHWEQSTGPYTLTVHPLKKYDEFEPNDDILHAASAEIGKPINASIMDTGDYDIFKIEAGPSKSVEVHIENRSTTLAPRIAFYNGDKSKVGEIAEGTGGANLTHVFEVAPGAPFYVEVGSHWNQTTGDYTLTVKDAPPAK